MSDAKIRAIVKRPDEQFGHVTHMSNTLRAFQTAVDGPIETLAIGSTGAVLICNEEGKNRDLPHNFKMGIAFPDLLVGTVVVVGADGENFTDCPYDFQTWKLLLRLWGN